MIGLIIIAIVFLLALGAVIAMAYSAPYGYEADDGWHEGNR